MSTVLRHRRHPAALVVLLAVGLLVTGGLYALLAPRTAQATAEVDESQIAYGEELFLANCSTCHGIAGTGGAADENGAVPGPSLIGVGAASVDFQVATGRMPLQASGPQAPERAPQFDAEDTAALAAYVATLGPGPAIPAPEQYDPALGDVSRGAELFRVNCAMCHNFAGSGGALTEGKYAPSLRGVEPVHVYEAMLTGPQSMPVFGDGNLTPEDKRDVIAYLDYLDTGTPPGGFALGSLGPVAEGLVAWVVGISLLVGVAIWLGARAS